MNGLATKHGINWTDARFIALHAMRRQWRSMLLTVAYAALLIGYFVSVFSDVNHAGEGSVAGRASTMDVLVMVLILVIGTNFMSGEYWSAGADRFMARRAYFRALPVSAGSVVVGRLILNLAVLVPNLISLYIAATVAAYPDEHADHRLAMVLTLGGLSVMGSGFLVWTEMTMTSKRYWIFSSVGVLAIFPLLLVMGMTTGFSIERLLREVTAEHPFLSALIALALGIVGLVLSVHAAISAYLERDPVP